MEWSLILEYSWVLVILVVLEGVLAADNAMVLAIMVKHLPEKQRKKALFYGLLGAFIFRVGSLFIISLLVDFWFIQGLGALYLFFIAGNHLVKKFILRRDSQEDKEQKAKKTDGAGFWMTVVKVEFADIAFAVDSILAAVAIAMALPPTPIPEIGGMDGGQFLVILFGGLIGVIIMRFAATYFVKLIKRRPGLETAAFMIVGWVGVKLLVITLAHEDLAIIPYDFAHSTLWKIIFYAVLVGIAVTGWFASDKKDPDDSDTDEMMSVMKS
ncbi:TerC family protein [Alkalibacillus salilacus]|uniref:YkoY family integral membrane protein n=1 Tax=Alkalibacillus salilacus TaxID=284582 RepID=A0ABT9VAS6_9BACI|nr:TerC family protein [Alkalibacillus salilacus]MDQ0158064.1 YkoY family integral membrane protein [Alkalibacillus salilacus]